CELSNSFGTAYCDPLVVTVKDAAPSKPILSHNNWNGDGIYTINMNLWWGTNATEYRLLENGQVIDTQILEPQTPRSQAASTAIVGKEPGSYEYVAVLVNSAGETSSERIIVTVNR